MIRSPVSRYAVILATVARFFMVFFVVPIYISPFLTGLIWGTSISATGIGSNRLFLGLTVFGIICAFLSGWAIVHVAIAIRQRRARIVTPNTIQQGSLSHEANVWHQ
jgi:ABC-type sugar transport system permease subunit